MATMRSQHYPNRGTGWVLECRNCGWWRAPVWNKGKAETAIFFHEWNCTAPPKPPTQYRVTCLNCEVELTEDGPCQCGSESRMYEQIETQKGEQVMATRKARVELGSKKASDVLDQLGIVQQYLPTNYTARLETHENPPYILIEGEDDHGWTLDGYVIPRLGSGLIVATEIK
jgi:hypothetical protein